MVTVQHVSLNKQSHLTGGINHREDYVPVKSLLPNVHFLPVTATYTLSGLHLGRGEGRGKLPPQTAQLPSPHNPKC